MPIRQHLTEQSAFEPAAIDAMSQAFEDACAALRIGAQDRNGREAIATRIIDLARAGVIDAAMLRDRVLRESRALA